MVEYKMGGSNPFEDERRELLRWQIVVQNIGALIVELNLQEKEDWKPKLSAMQDMHNELTRELAELDLFTQRGVRVIRPEFRGERFEGPDDFGLTEYDFVSAYPATVSGRPVGAGNIAADILRRRGRKVDTLRVSAHFFGQPCQRWVYNRGREQGGVRLLRLFTWTLDYEACFQKIGIGDNNCIVGDAPVHHWYSVLSPLAFNMVTKTRGTHYINQEIADMTQMVMNQSSNLIEMPSFNANQTLEFEWRGKVDGIAIITAHAE